MEKPVAIIFMTLTKKKYSCNINRIKLVLCPCIYASINLLTYHCLYFSKFGTSVLHIVSRVLCLYHSPQRAVAQRYCAKINLSSLKVHE